MIFRVPGPPPPEPPARDCPAYQLGLDLGQVAPGHRLIAEGFCLHDSYVTLFYSFTGGATEQHRNQSELSLNAWYDADVSPESADYHGAFGLSDDGQRVEGSIEYPAPPAEATVAWFDIFPVDFDTIMHVDKDWAPDDDYLRSRVSRLTIDLVSRTGSVELFT